MLPGVFNKVGDAVHSATPQLLVLVEQVAHDAQSLEIAAHDLAASDALLGDQAGAFEDGDVLLDRREAHGIVAGELDDTLLGADRAADDVSASAICEGAEHAVEVGRCDLQHIQPYGCILPMSRVSRRRLESSCRFRVAPFDVSLKASNEEHLSTMSANAASLCTSFNTADAGAERSGIGGHGRE